MTRVVGLTGGIGSGKSTVARFFSELGVPVYYADDAARTVMQTPGIIAKLKSVFGEYVFEDGILNRKRLAQIVFSDKQKLDTLNKIVHPAVKDHFTKWLSSHASAAFVIREAAILFESGSYKDCDFIIAVTAPIEIKIQRVMDRDSVTREDVLKRMENQWGDAEKIALSDFVIENVNLEQTKQEVVKIFKTLKKL